MGKSMSNTAVMEPVTLQQALLFTILTLAIYTMWITAAYADPVGAVVCAAAGFIYGDAGRGLATIGVIMIGIGATLGRVSWGLAVTVGIGMSIIFNAGGIVLLLTGKQGC